MQEMRRQSLGTRLNHKANTNFSSKCDCIVYNLVPIGEYVKRNLCKATLASGNSKAE